MKTRVIAFINQKGGVGKSTCTFNVAAGLARRKRKVLVIDSDPQGSVSTCYGVIEESETHSLLNVLKEESSVEENILHMPNGTDLIPSNITLAAYENSKKAGDYDLRLKRNLYQMVKAGTYDYIIIDCPPSLGLLSNNAINASTEIFVVMVPELLAIPGLALLQSTVEQSEQRHNSQIPITGVIINMYQPRRNAHKQVRELIVNNFPMTFKSTIRNSTTALESVLDRKDVFAYNAKSPIAEDFQSLCKEIIRMEKK